MAKVNILILTAFLSAYIALGLNSAAYQAEYFRGAIQSISSGQMMAAQSLGMSKPKAVLFVIVPQAFRLALPSWSNEVVSPVKVASIVYLIAVPDLMTKAKILSSRYSNPIETYLTVAVFLPGHHRRCNPDPELYREKFAHPRPGNGAGCPLNLPVWDCRGYLFQPL
jgi:ABC-type amino acid transport system permease subunit